MELPTFETIPRAVAVDLDGTLLNSQARLSERSRAAVLACVGQGIPVVVATSRPARTLLRAIGDDLARTCSLVIMNGASGQAAPPLSGAFRETIATEVARGVVEVLTELEPKVRLTLELEGWEFGANWAADAETLWERNAATPDMVVSVEEALARGPAKIVASRGGADVSDLAAGLSRKYGEAVSVLSSDGMAFLYVLSGRTSKSAALRRLLRSRGIPLADVLAFGDDIPDIDMLTSCGTAVAVANAVPEVQAVCEYATAGNDDDGVAVVLERMLEATAEGQV